MPHTNAQLTAIDKSSRYSAEQDRIRKIEDFDKRNRGGFSGVCLAMENDSLIYASTALDALRNAAVVDAKAAYDLVMTQLRPSHVDAVLAAETKINSFKLLKNETVPAAIQRLTSFDNCLPAGSRTDETTLMRHMKRAIKAVPAASSIYLTKVETMMDRDPPVTYPDFCQGLTRKYEESQAEAEVQSALNVESKQQSHHNENENEKANYSKGKGGRGGGKHRGGRGGRGRHMAKGQTDARIGGMYYGKGGYGEEHEDDTFENHQPFYRGGFRHNGGRGYDFGGKGRGGKSSGGKSYYQGTKGGKGHYQSPKAQFQGYCNKCNTWGHKEVDCRVKKARY